METPITGSAGKRGVAVSAHGSLCCCEHERMPLSGQGAGKGCVTICRGCAALVKHTFAEKSYERASLVGAGHKNIVMMESHQCSRDLRMQ